MSFKTFMAGVKDGFVKHSPSILVGVGIAGSVGAVILGVKATPKALKLIEERKEKEKKKKLTVSETIQTTWKCYIPTIATEAVSVACIIGSRKIDAKRYAALAGLYSLTESQLSTYKEKVKEVVGEKKAEAINDAVAEETVKQHPAVPQRIISTGLGNTLCYDPKSDRYFYSDVEYIRKAINTLNHRMTAGMEMYVSLNDFYEEIGIPKTDYVGDILGWNACKGLISLTRSYGPGYNDQPCLIVDFAIEPTYDYRDLH